MSLTDEVLAAEKRLLEGDTSPAPDTSAIFDELLHDGVLVVQAGGTSIGKAPMLKGHQPPRKRSFSKIEQSEVVTQELGEMVVVACRTEYFLPERSFAMRTCRLWRRVDGNWKVVLVTMSSDD